MEQRFFTVHEANALIPFLSSKLGELRRLSDALKAWAQSSPPAQDITLRGGMPVPFAYVSLLTEFQGAVSDICGTGCQLKDLEKGLVDFPTIWEGREVYLCWKLGEPEVGHWHEVEAGYAGRRSLQQDP